DAYHGRPWCMWELLTAKKHGRPILIWDLSHRGTLRSFPYLGNVPVVRTPDARFERAEDTSAEELDVESVKNADVETVLLAFLSEGMRMEIWAAHATAVVKASAIARKTKISARPPELADLARQNVAGAKKIVVYPDPPIGLHERELLASA